MLSDDALLRYSRQILMPEWDMAGQEAIAAAQVLVVGAGGLGAAVIQYLAAAGVGHLILMDHDEVELSNLQRQVIHTTDQIGEPKVMSAQRAVQALNPLCQVTAIARRCDANLAAEWVPQVQAIVDCTDHFEIRFLLNELSQRYAIPLVSGAAIRFDGQLSVYDPRDPLSPCYHCLYDAAGSDDMRCVSNGVLAPVVGLVGTIQATETLKLLAGIGSLLVGRLLLIDALTMRFREVKLKRNPGCPVCAASAPEAKGDH